MSEAEDFSSHETLWSRIKSLIRPPEEPQLYKIIGADVVDNNEVLATELESLWTILTDYRESNDRLSSSQSSARSLLPAPPQRELLQAKVLSLLNRSSREGVVFTPKSSRERAVVEYVIDPSMPSRPSSAFPTPPTPSTGQRPLTARSIDLEQTSTKLNVMEVDEILKDLRESFEEEHKFLLEEVERVRQQLEHEMTFNEKSSSFKVPTIQELTSLEKKLEEEEKRIAHEHLINSLPTPTRSSPSIGPGSFTFDSPNDLSRSTSRGSTKSLLSSRGATPPPGVAFPGTLSLSELSLDSSPLQPPAMPYPPSGGYQAADIAGPGPTFCRPLLPENAGKRRKTPEGAGKSNLTGMGFKPERMGKSTAKGLTVEHKGLNLAASRKKTPPGPDGMVGGSPLRSPLGLNIGLEDPFAAPGSPGRLRLSRVQS